MEITINGTPHQVHDHACVDRAVALVTSSVAGIAVAVNGELVRRAAWVCTQLAEGDQVEVLTAVQGG
jgi:sulfur carrier protein